MNLLYVVFDMAICVIAIRSYIVLGSGSRWTRVGWVANGRLGVSAALRYVVPGPPANLRCFRQSVSSASRSDSSSAPFAMSPRPNP